MTKLHIPHDTWVLVGDGRKALFLRQDGDTDLPNLTVQRVLSAEDNPPTREQGSDRPGRSHSSTGEQRSAVGQTDWHDLGEERFAKDIVALLEGLVRERKLKHLVLAAPPKTLADLRAGMSDQVKATITAEVHKDYTKHPLDEIERLLIGD
jgi:protein required for attachment to host cells